METKKIIVYLSIVYLISWTIQLIALYGTTGLDSDEAELLLLTTMITPTLVTIFYLIRDKPLRRNVLWKPSRNIFQMTLLAVAVPTFIAFATVAICGMFDFGKSGWFNFSGSVVEISGGPWLLGTGSSSWLHAIANISLTAVAFAVLSGIPAAGEEFTWRGFLQGIFIERWGMTRGIIFLGLIWSFWHLPVLLAGYNHPEYPILGSFLLQPIQEVAVSFFLAWLTISAKSFIPAAIAHGAGNSIQEGVISNIAMQSPVIYRDLVSLFVTVIVGLVFWYLLSREIDLKVSKSA